jgi:clan AA aspartic protease
VASTPVHARFTFSDDRSLKFDVLAVVSLPAVAPSCVFAQTRSRSTYPTAMPGAKMATTSTDEQGKPMGYVHVDITLRNLFAKKSINVRALVDTGAFMMGVPANIAMGLGFDLEEMSTREATLADGTRVRRPVVPLQVGFQERYCSADAIVLGDECMVGVLVLEAMGLVVDPVQQRVIPNPKHPEGLDIFPGFSAISGQRWILTWDPLPPPSE